MSFLDPENVPGTVLSVEQTGVVVACGEGSLQLTGLQIPGKKPCPWMNSCADSDPGR